MAPIVTATLSSSSTTSSLPLGMLNRASDGEGDAEGRATAFTAAQLDRAAVRLHDALRHPQTETRALFVLGREERLEDVRQVLLGDALACIANLNVHRFGHQELWISAV